MNGIAVMMKRKVLPVVLGSLSMVFVAQHSIGQRAPTKPILDIDPSKPIKITTVLGGLHVDYRRAV